MAPTTLRVARPTDNLAAITRMYRGALGLSVLAAFEDHQGFDGIVLGLPDHPYHLEFTHHRGRTVGRAPTADNLLVFYIPEATEWQATCGRMRAAGFREVPSCNPYWETRGRTFEDIDGYRVVLENAEWNG
jgi:catechol 2,3-dioxygenase-like lactoylglutathione lyase family enzyme